MSLIYDRERWIAEHPKAAAVELPTPEKEEAVLVAAREAAAKGDALIYVSGHEPYTVDFGDHEYAAWLETNLSVEELARRRDAFGTYWTVAQHVPMPRRWMRWPGSWLTRARSALLWPWARRYRRYDRLAEERGGPAPGPSWKVRTEFVSSEARVDVPHVQIPERFRSDGEDGGRDGRR